MSFSNFVSYMQTGISSVFQFILYPVNMIRRFSYSLMTVLANRITRPSIKEEANTLFLQDNKFTTIPMKMSDKVDTVINLDSNSMDYKVVDDSSSIADSVTPIPSSSKRHSISDEVGAGHSFPVEKKPKLNEDIDLIRATEFRTGPDKETGMPLTAKPVKSGSDNSKDGKEHIAESKMTKQEARQAFAESKTKASKKNKRSKPSESSGAPDEKTSHPEQRVQKFNPRPNYFVGIQVNDPEVRLKLESLQEKMLDVLNTLSGFDRQGKKIDRRAYQEALVSVKKFHLTLHVIHLKDDADIERAQQVLQIVWERFRDEFKTNPLTMTIQGVGHFGRSVIYAKLSDEECSRRLRILAEAFRDEFKASQIHSDSKPFKPHLTIAKASSSARLKRMKVYKLPELMWSGLENEYFGRQKVGELQLLKMQEKDSSGYYKCIKRLPLSQTSMS